MNNHSILNPSSRKSLRQFCARLPLRALALGLFALGGGFQSLSAEEAAPPVVVHEVAAQDVQPVLEFPTRIRSGEDIKIIPRVEGNLIGRRFRSGDAVQEGDLLYLIEPRPFEIALEQRKAELDQARAALTLAKQSLGRAERLAEKKAIATQALEEARANHGKAAGDVAAAELAVERATLELGHTRVTAKANGVISNADVSIGDLVGPTRGALGTLDVLNPVRAHIHVDEKLDTAFYQRELAGEKIEFDFRLRLSTGDTYPQPGKVVAWDAQVDPGTGTRTVKLEFPNVDILLTPGMSATVLATEKRAEGNLAIPQRAVQQDQLGHYVLVVREDNTLEQRHLKLGPQVASWWLVEDNLKAGERVVVEGLQQVRPGVKVEPKPEGE